MSDPHDTFRHDHKLYDLTKVRKLMRDKESFLLPIKDLLWIHEFDKPDEERVLKAKNRHPLFVCHWNGRYVVVDGIHRLERYRRKGITVIPVKLVTDEILKKTYVGRAT